MANNVIKRKWNMNSMVQIEDLTGMTFQDEAAGHTFEISAIDDAGNAVALSGTPAGVFLRPDNTDQALTCSVSNGKVYATLPAGCYDIPGRFGLTIFLTSNSQTAAIYAAVGTVARTSSGTASPGTTQDVVDLINAINAAIAQIPASDTNLKAAMAPTYSTSALYAVGDYAWYNGVLYKCITAITSGETWTSSHWTAANMGGDVSALKSAIISTYGAICNISKYNVEQGVWENNAKGSSSKRIRSAGRIPVKAGDRFVGTPNSLYCAISVYSNESSTSALENSGWLGGTNKINYVVLNDGVATVNIANANSYGSSTDIIPSDMVMELVHLNKYLDKYQEDEDISILKIDVSSLKADANSIKKVIYNITKDNVEQGMWENNRKQDGVLKRIKVKERITVNVGDVFVGIPNNLYCGIQVFENESATAVQEETGWIGGTEPIYYIVKTNGVATINIANASSYSASTNITPSDMVMELTYINQCFDTAVNHDVADYQYSYEGAQITRNRYAAKKLFQLSYSGSTLTLNGVDVWGDYFIAALSPNIIRVYSLKTYALLHEISVASGHANSLCVTGEFYDQSDPIPVMITTYGTEIIYVRINSEWVGSILNDSFEIGSEYGYNPTSAFDIGNDLMYSFGYSQNDTTSDIIFTVTDLQTKEVVSRKTISNFGTMQDMKYCERKIYIATAKTTSPHDEKIVVKDIEGNTETIIRNFPSILTNTELEGLAVQKNGGNGLYVTNFFDVVLLQFP